ncbi:MAG: hypothetical protein IJ635_05450 [Bacteroidaceae bacterium]|nr:hypothetical protein [Bacteroidaceae bacterium]
MKYVQNISKNLWIALWALTIFAACSESNEVSTIPDDEPFAVSFAASTFGPTETTRAGKTGIITIDELKEAGFGVFAYATENADYANTFVPNFMYNQKVLWDATLPQPSWTYTPLKYWPNGNATADNAGATGTPGGKVSFFAYAPHVEVTSGTGTVADATTGIIALTANTAAGDPKITYVAPTTPNLDKTVDILWGVAASDSYDAIDHPSNTTLGMPLTNLTKPTVGEKVQFRFVHATSRLNLRVQGAFDEIAPNTNNVDANTRILVNSITVTAGINKGQLNLCNNTANVPTWEGIEGTEANNISITKDDEFAVSGDIFTADKMEEYTTDQMVSLMNTSIKNVNDIETFLDTPSNFDDLPEGVTNQEKSVLNQPLTALTHTDPETGEEVTTYTENPDVFAYLFIPAATDGSRLNTIDVAISYDVITRDPALVRNTPAGFSIIHNHINRTLTLPDDTYFDANKQYTLRMLLGMTTVKLEVETIDGWEEEATTTNINF